MTGELFEKTLLFYLTKIEGCTQATVEQDRYQGTDLFYYGVPIDITYSRTKDHLLPGTQKALPGYNAWTALRTGSNYHKFEQPVIILGYCSLELDIAIDQVQDHAEKILELLADEYWQLMDQYEAC